MNEVKTIEELNRANARIKALEKQIGEMNKMALYYQSLAKRQSVKIEKLEKSLLNAVTTLDWKE